MLIYLLPLAAYLFGSISTAVLIARAMGLQDPREVGSRNPGATNILRYGGKTAAVLTLLGYSRGHSGADRPRPDRRRRDHRSAVRRFSRPPVSVFFSFRGGKG
jgi:glycerol-3-phosphate acyltransferase PlsY